MSNSLEQSKELVIERLSMAKKEKSITQLLKNLKSDLLTLIQIFMKNLVKIMM